MNRHARKAFTLIEVLLVILIIGMLAGVVFVTVGGTQDKAKRDLTEVTIKKIESKIEQYGLDVGHYPTEGEGGLDALTRRPNFDDEKTAENWAGPYVKSSELVDGWGGKLSYEPMESGAELSQGVRFKVWSNGPDRQSNTADDITNIENEQR